MRMLLSLQRKPVEFMLSISISYEKWKKIFRKSGIYAKIGSLMINEAYQKHTLHT